MPALAAAFGPLPAYELAERQWMYRPVHNDYFYVLGFNKLRLLAAADNWRFVASLRGEAEAGLDHGLRLLTERE